MSATVVHMTGVMIARSMHQSKVLQILSGPDNSSRLFSLASRALAIGDYAASIGKILIADLFCPAMVTRQCNLAMILFLPY